MESRTIEVNNIDVAPKVIDRFNIASRILSVSPDPLFPGDGEFRRCLLNILITRHKMTLSNLNIEVETLTADDEFLYFILSAKRCDQVASRFFPVVGMLLLCAVQKTYDGRNARSCTISVLPFREGKFNVGLHADNRQILYMLCDGMSLHVGRIELIEERPSVSFSPSKSLGKYEYAGYFAAISLERIVYASDSTLTIASIDNAHPDGSSKILLQRSLDANAIEIHASIAVDDHHRVWVYEFLNGKVSCFNPDLEYLSTVHVDVSPEALFFKVKPFIFAAKDFNPATEFGPRSMFRSYIHEAEKNFNQKVHSAILGYTDTYANTSWTSISLISTIRGVKIKTPTKRIPDP